MQDDKPFDWPGQPSSTDENASSSLPSGSDVFRNWLTRAPKSRRRASFDPALYTWKGYRQWKSDVTEQSKDSKD